MEDGSILEFDTVPRLLSDTTSAFYNMALEAGIDSAHKTSQFIAETV